MDEQSQSNIYSELLKFLDTFGRQLDCQGGVAFGLAPTRATEFVGKLEQSKTSLHGFEVWRQGNDRHTLSHSDIWYSEPAHGAVYREALSALNGLALSENDLVFIQF